MPPRVKLPKKGRILAQNSVFDQNSKELLELFKYFLGFGPFFKKKVGKNRGKKAYFRVFFLQNTLFYPILPILLYFTLLQGSGD